MVETRGNVPPTESGANNITVDAVTKAIGSIQEEPKRVEATRRSFQYLLATGRTLDSLKLLEAINTSISLPLHEGVRVKILNSILEKSVDLLQKDPLEAFYTVSSVRFDMEVKLHQYLTEQEYKKLDRKAWEDQKAATLGRFIECCLDPNISIKQRRRIDEYNLPRATNLGYIIEQSIEHPYFQRVFDSLSKDTREKLLASPALSEETKEKLRELSKPTAEDLGVGKEPVPPEFPSKQVNEQDSEKIIQEGISQAEAIVKIIDASIINFSTTSDVLNYARDNSSLSPDVKAKLSQILCDTYIKRGSTDGVARTISTLDMARNPSLPSTYKEPLSEQVYQRLSLKIETEGLTGSDLVWQLATMDNLSTYMTSVYQNGEESELFKKWLQRKTMAEGDLLSLAKTILPETQAPTPETAPQGNGNSQAEQKVVTTKTELPWEQLSTEEKIQKAISSPFDLEKNPFDGLKSEEINNKLCDALEGLVPDEIEKLRESIAQKGFLSMEVLSNAINTIQDSSAKIQAIRMAVYAELEKKYFSDAFRMLWDVQAAHILSQKFGQERKDMVMGIVDKAMTDSLSYVPWGIVEYLIREDLNLHKRILTGGDHKDIETWLKESAISAFKKLALQRLKEVDNVSNSEESKRAHIKSLQDEIDIAVKAKYFERIWNGFDKDLQQAIGKISKLPEGYQNHSADQATTEQRETKAGTSLDTDSSEQALTKVERLKKQILQIFYGTETRPQDEGPWAKALIDYSFNSLDTNGTESDSYIAVVRNLIEALTDIDKKAQLTDLLLSSNTLENNDIREKATRKIEEITAEKINRLININLLPVEARNQAIQDTLLSSISETDLDTFYNNHIEPEPENAYKISILAFDNIDRFSKGNENIYQDRATMWLERMGNSLSMCEVRNRRNPQEFPRVDSSSYVLACREFGSKHPEEFSEFYNRLARNSTAQALLKQNGLAPKGFLQKLRRR